MFIKTIQGHYRQLDGVAYVGAVNDNGTWKLFAGNAATPTDPDKIAAYGSQQDAEDALAELLALLGVTPQPGEPT